MEAWCASIIWAQQCLYFFPLPQGQVSLRPGFIYVLAWKSVNVTTSKDWAQALLQSFRSASIVLAGMLSAPGAKEIVSGSSAGLRGC